MTYATQRFLSAVYTHAKTAWKSQPKKPLAILALRRTLNRG